MYVFGIDIGGTSVKLGIFNENRFLLDKWSINTNPNKIFADISKSIDEYCSNKYINKKDIIAYGIGIPGQIKNNMAINCVNLGWKSVDVINEFKKVLNTNAQIYVANDANLAAYGEYTVLEEDYDSIVLMTLGTGVGGGVVCNKVIQEGNDGIAGEIGHLKIDNEFNFTCCCGKKGCLETVSSARGILNVANYLEDKYNFPNERKFDSAKSVINLARCNDTVAMEALDVACRNLAKAMANIALVIDPNAFIIGGGVSEAGEILIERIKKHYALECFSNFKNVDVKLSKLKNDAGIYGGAALAINKIKGVYR